MQSVTHKHKIIGRANAGENASVKLHEFGGLGKPGQVVELTGDGQVDQAFLDLEHSDCDKDLIRLDDPRLQRFVARAAETVKAHQPGPGAQPWDARALQHRLTKVLQSTDLDGISRPRLSQDGNLHVDAWLQNQQRNIVQYVWLAHGPEGSKVSLTSERAGGRTCHVMEAPLAADNSIEMSRLEERMEIHVPWFDSHQLKGVSEKGLTDVDDPRLSKILQSVDRGARLHQDALGPEWTMTNDQDCQVFRLGAQIVTADYRDFSVTFETTEPAFRDPAFDKHRCNPAIRWHNGNFNRGSVTRTTGYEPRFYNTTSSIF
jgi:hypothetical protein